MDIDKEEQREIKNIIKNGRTNYLKESGRLVKNPDYIFKGKTQKYGVLGGIGNGTIDYFLHISKGVKLGEKKEYYKKNKPKVKIYGLKRDEEGEKTNKLVEYIFKAEIKDGETNWKKEKEEINKIGGDKYGS